jgi:histidinol dehydrogenase
MKIISAAEFDNYWKNLRVQGGESAAEQADPVTTAVNAVIAAVRAEGDRAVRRFASRFDKSSPQTLEVPAETTEAAYRDLAETEPELTAALELAADHIRRFSEKQRAQFSDFEYEMAPGLLTGQRVIPVERAAIYVPAGRFPLISTVLMGVIPALAAGVEEVLVASPPLEDGLPDRRIMAAAYLAGMAGKAGKTPRIFAIGGAQAVAALALGTESVPQVDVIAGPGNKYVAAAKRILFGEVGIDFVAGPTDVLIIADGRDDAASGSVSSLEQAADLVAADMLAQAEHDPDARARALVPGRDLADRIAQALERRLAALPTAPIAAQSLDAGGLIIIYDTAAEAIRIANAIAPEHLELQVSGPEDWIPGLRNYGSLFTGSRAVEALGDYSAGINHTLPTSGSARFTGGLSVRHFLKTLTTLRCTSGPGYDKARLAAEQIAQAEGLIAHAESLSGRKG